MDATPAHGRRWIYVLAVALVVAFAIAGAAVYMATSWSDSSHDELRKSRQVVEVPQR